MTPLTQVAKAQKALAPLAASSGPSRDLFLWELAGLLEKESRALLEANLADVANAEAQGLSPALVDRLALNPQRIDELGQGLIGVSRLEDPLGAIEDMKRRPDGLMVGRARVPLGLILFICEARPGAALEAAGVALKSGNGIIVKPGKEAKESSRVIGQIISRALDLAALPPEAATVLADLGRGELKELLALEGQIDLVIPRGGEGLIRFVAENSRVPVLKHYRGVCHLYVDERADLDMAVKLIVNSKADRPGTCNALECLLAHRAVAPALFALLAEEFPRRGVRVKAGPKAYPLIKDSLEGTEEAAADDFGREFLSLTLAAEIVEDLDEALAFIRAHGSRHTEAIVTADQAAAARFLREVDAGCVLANASTRLNDGACLGLGAEIGISTDKLHAYGPMGLKELTTRKFIVIGEGHLRR
ncbi:MAG: glutamate-5-semialdehyde dehydrogenase [Deltaproteobacteria bacterium]|jgi:glutamate-5-semialdehyde dehydrogenase|nr:glutamate-5-semialdehyde dehydrogenase [Deltaproteobacteria bacterium]